VIISIIAIVILALTFSGCGENKVPDPEKQVITPVFSPGSGTYETAQTITITCATAGAGIRYTNDGSTPTVTTGTLYEGPIEISNTQSMKAIAYKSGMQNSAVAVAAYVITNTVANPIFTPSAGTYYGLQSVAITCATEGAAIRYTTDGSEPTESSGEVYSGAIPVSADTTIKAIAYKEGWTSSSVVTAAYTIKIAPKIKIGGVTVSLGVDSLDAYPGLSWDGENERLVLNGYNGTYIHQYASYEDQSIRLWVAGNSTIDGGSDNVALFFSAGIIIEGEADATLTLKSNYNRVLYAGYYGSYTQVKDLTLVVDLDHTFGSNFTKAIHYDITVRGTGQLQITAKKSNSLTTDVYGILGVLTLEDTASATIEVIGENALTTNACGISDNLILNGSGACEITVTNNGTGTAQALGTEPTVPAGYVTTGAWDSGYVKYYMKD